VVYKQKEKKQGTKEGEQEGKKRKEKKRKTFSPRRERGAHRGCVV
jgi:hypothetical protein